MAIFTCVWLILPYTNISNFMILASFCIASCLQLDLSPATVMITQNYTIAKEMPGMYHVKQAFSDCKISGAVTMFFFFT